MTRVLIVDDRPDVRIGLKMRLCAEPDISVVGCAADAMAALDLVAELGPDVVLMDVEMPLIDGIEATGMLQERYPHVPVIVLTIHDDANTRARAEQARAAGFVSKENTVDCLLDSIRRASRAGSAGCRQ